MKNIKPQWPKYVSLERLGCCLLQKGGGKNDSFVMLCDRDPPTPSNRKKGIVFVPENYFAKVGGQMGGHCIILY